MPSRRVMPVRRGRRRRAWIICPRVPRWPSARRRCLLNADGEALVAWQDARNGRDDIFLARSTDGGRTWGAEDQRMDADEPGTALSRFPSLARAKDGRVALAWDDDRAGLEDVYVRVRSAGGQPQWGPEISRVVARAQARRPAAAASLGAGRNALRGVGGVGSHAAARRTSPNGSTPRSFASTTDSRGRGAPVGNAPRPVPRDRRPHGVL